MPYHLASTGWSPRRVLCERTAHCLEGAVFAAAALRVLGYPPLLLDLEAVQDSLRYRAPVYRTIRELALSYFEGYVNPSCTCGTRACCRARSSGGSGA
jgi:hypothetical protein